MGLGMTEENKKRMNENISQKLPRSLEAKKTHTIPRIKKLNKV